MVLVGDHDADEGGAGELIADPIGAGAARNARRLARKAHPFQVVVDGPLARRQRVGLGIHGGGGGGGMAAPDIERIGDVHDLFGFFGEPQNQLEVLAAVVLRPLSAAGGLEQPPGKGGQMGDVVAAPQVVRLKVRLEVVVHQML